MHPRWKLAAWMTPALLIGPAFLVSAQDGNGPLLVSPSEQFSPPVVTDSTEDSEEDYSNENFEVLTHGPVHEAFAEQYFDDPEPGMTVAKSPPEPINEIPPEVMPEGENVEWIPGYWGWDDDREDFIWISGLWRDVPPDQRWVPGYWTAAENGGSQWVTGFWAPEEAEKLSYLPEAPPASQENGPNVASPGENYFWVPGSWVYENNYQWRPGYWEAVRPDWVWVPMRYYWTPQGYVCVGGYWDYPPTVRGTLFSPIVVHNYQYTYVPQVVVPVAPLMVNLFVRPGRSCYYFGDYYGASYVTAGYTPWVSAFSMSWGRRGRIGFYDPMWSYYRFGHRNHFNRMWGWNQFYRHNIHARPPRTYAAIHSHRHGRHSSWNMTQQAVLGTSLRHVRHNQHDRDRYGFGSFREVDSSRRERYQESIRLTRDYQRERSHFHRGPHADSPDRGRDGGRPSRDVANLDLPRWGHDRNRDRSANASETPRIHRPSREGRLPETPRLSDRGPGGRTPGDRTPGDRGVRGEGADGSGSSRTRFASRDRLNIGEAPQLGGNAREEVERQRREFDDRVRGLREGRPSRGGEAGNETPRPRPSLGDNTDSDGDRRGRFGNRPDRTDRPDRAAGEGSETPRIRPDRGVGGDQPAAPGRGPGRIDGERPDSPRTLPARPGRDGENAPGDRTGRDRSDSPRIRPDRQDGNQPRTPGSRVRPDAARPDAPAQDGAVTPRPRPNRPETTQPGTPRTRPERPDRGTPTTPSQGSRPGVIERGQSPAPGQTPDSPSRRQGGFDRSQRTPTPGTSPSTTPGDQLRNRQRFDSGRSTTPGTPDAGAPRREFTPGTRPDRSTTPDSFRQRQTPQRQTPQRREVTPPSGGIQQSSGRLNRDVQRPVTPTPQPLTGTPSPGRNFSSPGQDRSRGGLGAQRPSRSQAPQPQATPRPSPRPQPSSPGFQRGNSGAQRSSPGFQRGGGGGGRQGGSIQSAPSSPRGSMRSSSGGRENRASGRESRGAGRRGE